MPASYMAIMMESGDIRWRSKFNTDIPDSGPDDRRIVIEFEGDLEKVPWVKDLACSNVTVDLDLLAASAPELFDKPWLRGRGSRESAMSTMGNHYIIDIRL